MYHEATFFTAPLWTNLPLKLIYPSRTCRGISSACFRYQLVVHTLILFTSMFTSLMRDSISCSNSVRPFTANQCTWKIIIIVIIIVIIITVVIVIIISFRISVPQVGWGTSSNSERWEACSSRRDFWINSWWKLTLRVQLKTCPALLQFWTAWGSFTCVARNKTDPTCLSSSSEGPDIPSGIPAKLKKKIKKKDV